MRILHINCNYIGTTLHQLMVENLDALGYENQVFVPTYDKGETVIVPNKNVIISECFKKWDRLVFDYKQAKIKKSLIDKVKVDMFDCIHAYTLFTDGNCARNISKKYKIPYVVAVRNTDVNIFFAKLPYLRHRGIKIMRDAKAIFFLSESYRNQVFEKYVPKKYRSELLKKTRIIPNGIDDFWFNNLPIEKTRGDFPKEIKLVYAGRIDKNKNIPTTQEAMRILIEQGYNISLTVVGKIDNQAEYNRIVADQNTRVLPAMPKDKLIEVYRSADIFVMPSFTESFGLVYAEAMSQGLPVIYSQGQGFDGQYDNGIVGFSVDSHSAVSVADGIVNCIKNYYDISSRVVEKSKKFSWNKIIEHYCKIYRNIEE